ncbi:MAG: YgzB family protein [Chloroflexota bacterium]|nr:YgzB family protein [Chloroflexota bacterium]
MCDAPIRHCANASCTNLLDSARSIYCSPACKQRCYRARHADPRLAKVGTHPPKRVQTDRVLHSVYECSSCGERFVGLRRCPDCNLYLANLGLGGMCVHCDEPLLLTELLGDGGATLLD